MRNAGEYREVRDALADLQERGIVSSDADGNISYVRKRQTGPSRSPSNRMVGRLSVTRRGLGIVKVEETDDEIVVPPRFMKTALHGDIVAVVPFAHSVPRKHERKEEERLEGEIVEIVKRTNTSVVGTVRQKGHYFVVIPDDDRFPRDIYVAREDSQDATPGDKVVVHLHPWEDEHLNPEGSIVEVLGESGDARVEVMGVARSFGLPARFPDSVVHEVEGIDGTIAQAEIRSRLDYRGRVCFTIDPEDAKDFDDAISYEALDNGRARLGVHIADVSHFVKEGTLLDAEALQRGTSVYLVNEVVPMLPERLSNDLCSLRPHVDRLTYSVLMDVDKEGNVLDYKIARSIIHSARRFTYEEVQRILQERRGELAETLIPLLALTQVLLKERRRLGSIDFDTPEAKFRFDVHGLPAQIVPKVRLDAHRLVEECMLLANKTVAMHIARGRKGVDGRPFIYRVHDVPDPSRLHDLANFVKQFGYSLNTSHGVTARTLQKLLDKVEGSDVEYLINEVVLRSMAKAVYSDKNIGHFGLGFTHYTHFTSPIRRYPDLMVHRLLKEYEGGLSPKRRSELSERLPTLCRWTSECERRAAEAERTSVKVMQVEYMKRHVGDEFEGVIGGVTDFGLFVEINDLLVEGLVRMRDLADDYYLYDEKHYALRGRSRGKTYRLGDRVRVKVVAVHPEEQQIDFGLAE